MNESHSNASASSSSSLNSSVQDTEDDQTIASILAEEEQSKVDGRLGKRLSHLDSIPHTPRVNGEIPDVNHATLDHERLSERLVTYGLAELQMEGDGNCQFRALADQLFRNPDYHKHVRKQVIKQFGAKICLVTSFRDTCYIEILPKDKNPTRGQIQKVTMKVCDVSEVSEGTETGEIIEGEILTLSICDQQEKGRVQQGVLSGGRSLNISEPKGVLLSMPADLVQANLSSWREACILGGEPEEADGNALAMVTKESATEQEEVEGEGNLVLFEPCDSATEGEEDIEADPTPISMVTPSLSDDWLLKKIEDLQSCLGISCVGYEEQFKALIIAIEAGQQGSVSKRERELRRLSWSINYDSKEGSASRGRNKGRVGSVVK
ncbi:uncharacterized protein LOC122303308 isoform X2 [Carya illinoinensis]|uniref:uncharacterized protein LOC122303308 isoform X2 n=1 Tax=Carya illinoinensis TaxID=32201 RepID=UPI001C72747A|nr:uncharacterized protein LOC122303308 isoform X2 [Carya illinoinensis]